MLKRVLVVGLCLSTVAGTAWALSMKEEAFIEQQDKYFKDNVDYYNKQCGGKLKATIDWKKSFLPEVKKKLAGKINYSFYGYCSHALNSLAYMCRDNPKAKARIQKKVKSYHCKFGGKGKRKMSIKGGKVTAAIDWEASNNSKFWKDYIENNL